MQYVCAHIDTAFLNEKNKMLVLDLWEKFREDKNRYIPSYVQVIKVLNACLYYHDGDKAIEVLNYVWKRLDEAPQGEQHRYNNIHTQTHAHELDADDNNNDDNNNNDNDNNDNDNDNDNDRSVHVKPMRTIMKSANESRIYSYVLLTLYKEVINSLCFHTYIHPYIHAYINIYIRTYTY